MKSITGELSDLHFLLLAMFFYKILRVSLCYPFLLKPFHDLICFIRAGLNLTLILAKNIKYWLSLDSVFHVFSQLKARLIFCEANLSKFLYFLW